MSKIVSVYDGNIPMLSEAAALVQNNPLIPTKQRNRQAAVVRKAGRWFDTCAANAARVEGQRPPMPETIPFTRQNLKVAFARLTIAHLDVSKKSVENTLSELNGIADLLGMPRGFAFEALNAECKAVQDRLVTHEDRGSCIRILRVMSSHNIAPACAVEAVPLLRKQIDADWKVENKDRDSIARALTLEVWHTVSWRIGVCVGWRLSQFVEVDVDGEKRIMVCAPKGQPGNKRTPDQFLSPEAAALYRLFIEKYRDIILRHNKCGVDTPYLFPGRGGEQRHPHSMRQQMNNWVRKNTGLDFHPHAIRKINPKVILDADPTAKELAEWRLG